MLLSSEEASVFVNSLDKHAYFACIVAAHQSPHSRLLSLPLIPCTSSPMPRKERERGS